MGQLVLVCFAHNALEILNIGYTGIRIQVQHRGHCWLTRFEQHGTVHAPLANLACWGWLLSVTAHQCNPLPLHCKYNKSTGSLLEKMLYVNYLTERPHDIYTCANNILQRHQIHLKHSDFLHGSHQQLTAAFLHQMFWQLTAAFIC